MKLVLFTEKESISEELTKDSPQLKLGVIMKQYIGDKDFSVHGSSLYALITEIMDSEMRTYIHSTIEYQKKNEIEFIPLEDISQESQKIKHKIENEIGMKEKEIELLKSALHQVENHAEQLSQLLDEIDGLDQEMMKCQTM